MSRFQPDFPKLLQDLHDARFSDIQIADMLSKMLERDITRQRIFLCRRGERPNPAEFDLCLCILKLHKQYVSGKVQSNQDQPPMEDAK